jgi:hypothetical protein
MLARYQSVEINIDILSRQYFYFDKPVPYYLTPENSINIYPVSVLDSEIFVNSIELFTIDKNSSPSVEIIQMPYLDFIIKILFQNSLNIDRFINLMKICLQIEKIKLDVDEKEHILIKDQNGNIINHKHFDNIKKIILYQNIIEYNEDYISPELKEAMQETDALKNKNIDLPNLERRIAIITAHCGLSKKDQLSMSYRSHSLLFKEIHDEVEYTVTKPIAIFNGKKIDSWFYPTKTDILDKYIMDKDKFIKSFGAEDSNISTIVSNTNKSNYDQMFKQFK